MDELMEYYITGGKMHMSKFVFVKELLIGDSVLRRLLQSSGNLASSPGITKDVMGIVTVDFSYFLSAKLLENPVELIHLLKKRYGIEIQGVLHYKAVYATLKHEFHFTTRLDEQQPVPDHGEGL